jgi:FAD:protein FMN transferase
MAGGATIERTRYLMGTLCGVMVQARDSARAERAATAALDDIARLEQVMSSWRASSELTALNRDAGRAHRCSADLFAVLDSARVYAAATHGAFDPTVEPLILAWDLRGAGRVPTKAARDHARARVGWERLHLDRHRYTARLEAGAALDLGGIGKGFALDRAAARLRAAGVDAALLNFGGELLALGRPGTMRNGVWPVRIADPAHRLRPVVELAVEHGAVSTSSQGERGFTSGGRRYGHVLDPRTGLPVESRASVTVAAATGTRADAISTALLVAGRDSARAWARRHPEDGILWLEPSGSAVRMWSWNVRSRALEGARVIRMKAAR